MHYIKHEYVYREIKFASSQLIFRGIRTCVLCNVLFDGGVYKAPKHVAVIINMINI